MRLAPAQAISAKKFERYTGLYTELIRRGRQRQSQGFYLVDYTSPNTIKSRLHKQKGDKALFKYHSDGGGNYLLEQQWHEHRRSSPQNKTKAIIMKIQTL